MEKGVLYIFDKLDRSKFRARFKLNRKDIEYIRTAGLLKIALHARDFVVSRLSAKTPKNDGKQTPFKGHPVFKSQHATATCCRKCLEKWHHIPCGRALREEEIDFIVELIMEWIRRQITFYPLK